MNAFLYIFLWFSSAFLTAFLCNYIARISQYIKKRKIRKHIEQEHANNLLNYSEYYSMEKAIWS